MPELTQTEPGTGFSRITSRPGQVALIARLLRSASELSLISISGKERMQQISPGKIPYRYRVRSVWITSRFLFCGADGRDISMRGVVCFAGAVCGRENSGGAIPRPRPEGIVYETPASTVFSEESGICSTANPGQTRDNRIGEGTSSVLRSGPGGSRYPRPQAVCRENAHGLAAASPLFGGIVSRRE